MFNCDFRIHFSNGIFHEGKLILAPNWGNKFVEIDVHTNEVKEWIPPFPYTTEDKSSYWKNGSIGFFYRDSFDFSAKFFYAPEHIIYNLDLYHNEATCNEFVFDTQTSVLHKIIGTKYDFVGKANYITYIAKRLGIATSDILFVGNSNNDMWGLSIRRTYFMY